MNIKNILSPHFEKIKRMNAEREKCQELVNREPESEEVRRITIRSLFSNIKGMCYLMKLTALHFSEYKGMSLSYAEVAMVNEETYFLGNKGKSITRPYCSSIKNNVMFAFRILARALEVDFKLDVGGRDFQEFQEAIKIRNRIIHPKGIEDLNVSHDDFNKVTRVHD